MNILLTGGAGFIGSHVADKLIEAGHLVTIIDNLSTGSMVNVPPDAEFIQIDIRDAKVEELFQNRKIEAIYHFAAQMDVRYSVKYPLEDLDINIAGSVNLLDMCCKYDVAKFIFASTGGAVYGEQDYFPATEDHPTRPISPYGVSKLSVEHYLYYFHNEFGVNGVALRFANVYGPRQNPHGEAGVVAIFCDRLISGEQAYIYGDGLQTRDYVFVEDVARVNKLALDLNGFQTFNIGTGVETDVVSLFEGLSSLTGSRMKREHKPPMPGEQRRSCIDPGMAGRLLGWRPEIPLSVGLAKTLEFFRHKAIDSSYR